MNQNLKQFKLFKFITLFLPGIFLIGFNIGTGSVTAMAQAGADYGMSLLWTIAISCLCTFFMINLYGKYTLITGETALQAFRKHIHPVVSYFFIIALTFGVCGSVMGVMGIVSEISYEWSKTFIRDGISPIYFSILYISMVYFIFWNGNTQIFERSAALIVAIMAAAFVANFFIMMPPAIDIFKGFIPSIPSTLEYSNKSPSLVISSMVGTTVFSGLFIIRTTLVKEAGWKIENYKSQRNDAFFSALLMFIISASIMAAASATLHAEGISLNKASQMITLLEPLAGPMAVSLFAIGIIAAGVSSQLPNVLMLPWLICDYSNKKRDMSLPKFRLLVLVISLLGLVVPIFEARPILVMIISQTFNAVILPVTVACIFYLTNLKSLMNSHANTWLINLILTCIFIFSIFSSYIGINGLFQVISNSF